MTYVCFKSKTDKNDLGTWYKTTGEVLPNGGVRAVRMNPGLNDRPVEIFGPGQSCAWDRTEYREEDVPDELWAAIAKQSLLA